MFIGVVLILVGFTCALGVGAGGAAQWVLAWVGATAILSGFAYMISWPRIMGKRADGVVPWWSTLLFWPWVLFTVLMGKCKVWFGREPVYHEVASGIFVGRRCQGSELPPGVEVVVDLTCERTEPRALREAGTYYVLPTLDGTAPARRPYGELLARLLPETRPIYIHCAMGHSRAATVAAGLLIGRGLAAGADEAEAKMKAIRPKVHFTEDQRRLVDGFAQAFHASDEVAESA